MKLDELRNFNEASLSRTYRMIQEHDAGMITAFRSATECGTGELITNRQNLQRNRSLGAKLRSKDFGYTMVKGSYIENYGSKNAREVGEQTFLVVDIKDKGNLKRTLIQFGEEFEQDSILFIPKGGETGLLIGTSQCPEVYPSHGQVEQLANPLFGHSGEFMTRVNGRPFILKSIPENFIPPPVTRNGKWGIKILAEKKWQNIEI